MTLFRPPLTGEEIRLLIEAVDDALPSWKEHEELRETMSEGFPPRWMKLQCAADSLLEFISKDKLVK